MENRYDRIQNIIAKRMERVKGKMDLEFKGKNPFGMEKMTDADIVAKYLELDPRVKQQLIMNFPNEWSQYENKVFQKMEGMRK